MATRHTERKSGPPGKHKAARRAGTQSTARDRTERNRTKTVAMHHDASARPHQNGRPGLEERMATGLGWFSIALGLAEVVAPTRLAQWIGLRADHRTIIRTMGMREIASGLGILSRQAPVSGMWARVGGDAVDLACLGAALLTPRAERGRIAAAAAAVAGVTALDLFCAQQLSRNGDGTQGSRPVNVSVAINRSREELYRYWHDLDNLPRFMAHLESVTATGEGRSHWKAKGPAGTTIEWDAEIVDDRPDELIAWRSLEGAGVRHSGSVRFEQAPGNRGTLVTVDLQYSPPGGPLGAGLAALFGEEPSQSVKRDLRRFKQVMETGEIVTTEGQPAGRSSSTSWKYDQAVR